MTVELFAPRARRDLREAVSWIARDDEAAARRLGHVAIAAAERLVRRPMLARAMPRVAPARFRFWSLPGYAYLLVLDTARDPPVVARVVHAARDLPAALSDEA